MSQKNDKKEKNEELELDNNSRDNLKDNPEKESIENLEEDSERNSKDMLKKKAKKNSKKKKSNKEKIKLDFHMNDFAGLAILIAIAVIIAVLINIIFFSRPKVSKLSTEGEAQTISLQVDEAIQPFWAPTENVKGFYVYMKNESGVNNGVYFSLNDSTLGEVLYWEIAPEQIKDGESVYLDLEGEKLEKGAFYYLNAWTDEDDDSDVGILGYSNMENGYGADPIDDLVWAHQVVYSGFSIFIVIIEALCILLAAIVFTLGRSNEKKEVILSMAFFGMAVLYFLVVPTNSMKNDEYSFYRAYTISKGQIFPERTDNKDFLLTLPESLPEGMDNLRRGLSEDGSQFAYVRQSDMMSRPLETDSIQITVPKNNIMSTVFYLPQALGLFIGQNVSNNYFLYYFDGRFLLFLVSTIMVVLAFKMFPEGCGIIYTVATIPVFIMNEVSFSAEGFMAVIALLYVALILGLRKKDTLAAKDKVLIIVSDVIISFMTIIHLPLVLLTLIVSKKDKVFRIVAVAVSVICFILRNVLFSGGITVIPEGITLKNILQGGLLGNIIPLNVIITIIFLAVFIKSIYDMGAQRTDGIEGERVSISKSDLINTGLIVANMCSLIGIYYSCV